MQVNWLLHEMVDKTATHRMEAFHFLVAPSWKVMHTTRTYQQPADTRGFVQKSGWNVNTKSKCKHRLCHSRPFDGDSEPSILLSKRPTTATVEPWGSPPGQASPVTIIRRWIQRRVSYLEMFCTNKLLEDKVPFPNDVLRVLCKRAKQATFPFATNIQAKD